MKPSRHANRMSTSGVIPIYLPMPGVQPVHSTAQMKKFFAASLPIIAILMLALMMSSPAFGQETDDWCDDHNWGDERERYCEVREITLPTGAISVDAGHNGGVSVRAWDRNEILVQVKVQARDEDGRDAAARLADRVEINTSGNDISASGPDRLKDRSWWASYRVYVPRNTDLDLEAHNGGIGIYGVEGRIRFDTQNGGVTLDRVAGDVQGRTSNGGLTVELAGSRWEGDGLDVETKNGGVKVAIPENYNAEFETGTRNGSIRIDFPVTVSGEIRRQLRTTLGSGGAPVRVITTNGGVRVGRSN